MYLILLFTFPIMLPNDITLAWMLYKSILMSTYISYHRNVWWGESLTNWLFLSIWWKKVWQINRLTNRLLIVSTNLDGFSLVNHRRFAKFPKIFPSPNFPAIWYLNVLLEYKSNISLYAWYNVLSYYAYWMFDVGLNMMSALNYW